ncbi:MAG: hypothetical protein IJ960_06685 [Oscillospiraceae bacterium]|nr:hypothetical protein [Oscillospiraceae bacterium]
MSKSKDLITALNARATFKLMQKRLNAEVEDGHVDYLTDIPAVLAGTLPDDLTQAFPPELVVHAKALLADPVALEALYTSFQRIAGAGLALNVMIRPEEERV